VQNASQSKIYTRAIYTYLIVVLTMMSNGPASAQENELRNARLTDAELLNATLSVLSSRRDYGRAYSKQLLGDAHLELWLVDKKRLYFSLPQNVSSMPSAVAHFLHDPTRIRQAEVTGKKMELDGKFLTRTPEKHLLFATDEENFKVDPVKEIHLTFGQHGYRFTPTDMALSLTNAYIYGGSLRVRRVPDGQRRPMFANHGAIVTQYGEPTLSALVGQITNSLETAEERIQALLDFVTNFIDYDEKEFYFGREFLQRPIETLLARKADCSNKVILFASLLEQLRIDYLLVYTKSHIYVAVPKGAFASDNGYELRFRDRAWVAAETTVKGFRIGATKVKQEEQIVRVEYIQLPKEKNVLYEFEGNTTIMFN
jgi:hypothetical protein